MKFIVHVEANGREIAHIPVEAMTRGDAAIAVAQTRAEWPDKSRFRPRLVDDLSYAPGPLIQLLREADHMPEASCG